MDEQSGFNGVKERLEHILDEVNAEDITLDAALALYEEAVKLGLSACELSEQDVAEAFPDMIDTPEEARVDDAQSEASGTMISDGAGVDDVLSESTGVDTSDDVSLAASESDSSDEAQDAVAQGEDDSIDEDRLEDIDFDSADFDTDSYDA